jgi:hypothetical protein
MPTLNVAQSIVTTSDDWLIVVLLPLYTILAVPAATEPPVSPVGPAITKALFAQKTASASLDNALIFGKALLDLAMIKILSQN